MKFACRLNLMDLLAITSRELGNKGDGRRKQTCNIETRHFDRKLYFNPGEFPNSPNIFLRCTATT